MTLASSSPQSNARANGDVQAIPLTCFCDCYVGVLHSARVVCQDNRAWFVFMPWTDARRTQSANNLIHASWALGYISGVNEAVNSFEKKDILARHDGQAILAWMGAYCGSHPLENIKSALDALVGELLKRANVK